MRFAIFLTVMIGAVTLAHWVVWRRCIVAPGWPKAVRRGLTVVLCLLFVMYLAGFLGIRFVKYDELRWLETPAFLWLGTLFYLFLFTLAWSFAVWGTRSAVRAVRRQPVAETGATELGRRELLARVGAIGATLAAGGTVIRGVRGALYEIVAPQVVVKLERLPRSLDGFRLVMLTDLHIGPILRQRFMRHVVDKANALRPDAVVICGDIADARPAHVLDDLRPLTELRSRCGTFYVTGNHEYYWGADDWVRAIASLGVRVLGNQRVSIGDAAGGASLDLAGIHDPTGGHWSHALAPHAKSAVSGRRDDRELILLAHQPLQVPDAVEIGAGLQLSGHTHGGQLWPFGALVQRAQPYISGLHRHAPGTQIYVSRGTGFWGPPMRVLAPAEITEIILTA
jgi:uncharacterized protein